ncbi:MAG: radical SAM/SPASM domain-containing protein [Patescibacteria group bacterium]
MRRILFKIPFFWFFYSFGWPKVLPANYTFSLTFKCNSRCLTCNIWQKSEEGELTQAEWQKIFLALGKSPYWVTLSGGEPFLRKDLIEIVKNLCQICQPKIITIPTNGISTAKIQKDVQAILKGCPKTRLIINLSLDGIGEKHDQIRGVKGNFDKAMATYKKLKRIKSRNFVLGIHTVISRENVKDFSEICDFVLDQLKPDSYVTEIAEQRVELETMGKDITPSLENYQRAVDYLEQKMRRQKLKGFFKLTQAFRFTYYDLVKKIMEKKAQVIPCYAGILSCQIASNGDVWQCCVRADVLGNLKKENFDFSKIWFSKKADKIRKSIKNRECYCPLANASYTNVLMSPTSMTKVIFNFF